VAARRASRAAKLVFDFAMQRQGGWAPFTEVSDCPGMIPLIEWQTYKVSLSMVVASPYSRVALTLRENLVLCAKKARWLGDGSNMMHTHLAVLPANQLFFAGANPVRMRGQTNQRASAAISFKIPSGNQQVTEDRFKAITEEQNWGVVQMLFKLP